MIRVGEESGELEKMLTKVADFYEDEVDAAIQSLTSIIEPLLMIFVGFIVGDHRHRDVPADVQDPHADQVIARRRLLRQAYPGRARTPRLRPSSGSTFRSFSRLSGRGSRSSSQRAVSNAAVLAASAPPFARAEELRVQWSRLRALTDRPFAIEPIRARPFDAEVFDAILEARRR